MTSRRRFLTVAAAGGTALWVDGAGAVASAPTHGVMSANAAVGFTLSVQPVRVFKRTSDQNKLRTEHWLFNLLLRSSQVDRPALSSLVVTCASGGDVLRTTTWPAAAVAKANVLANASPLAADGERTVAAFRIADAVPGDLAIDSVRCELAFRTRTGMHRIGVTVPIRSYMQKTRLIFPFEGNGMITQGGAWNDGHRNRSGMFAIDAIGLTDLYAAMIAQGDAAKSAAGWGRNVIAPAAGKVMIARGDRPDQPMLGVSDPTYFVPEFPDGGDPGNHVVIDHGEGEFSLIAHLQHGSVRVREGERVDQGHVLGLLGNSGDSSSPHVHHQLQDGPRWTDADALPHAYINGPQAQHDRGMFFQAKR
jgi:murein DD-endopeptidase MepM/ murein hydrolase activator NlpD